MDFVMPPLKISKFVGDVSHSRNNNYFLPMPTNTNENSLYTCENYPLKVINNFNALRHDSRFCDVEIVTENRIFKVCSRLCTKQSVSELFVFRRIERFWQPAARTSKRCSRVVCARKTSAPCICTRFPRTFSSFYWILYTQAKSSLIVTTYRN